MGRKNMNYSDAIPESNVQVAASVLDSVPAVLVISDDVKGTTYIDTAASCSGASLAPATALTPIIDDVISVSVLVLPPTVAAPAGMDNSWVGLFKNNRILTNEVIKLSKIDSCTLESIDLRDLVIEPENLELLSLVGTFSSRFAGRAAVNSAAACVPDTAPALVGVLKGVGTSKLIGAPFDNLLLFHYLQLDLLLLILLELVHLF